ncbi:MAG: hypothetical protein GY832_41505 [Chloroflexi bacterium]|nr:hypothetical protein [Chloroflexota bacterium]
MGVKPGYKQTEVGVIPEDWEVVSLRNLISPERKITYGIVVPGPDIQNGIPMIRAQDYSKGWVDLDDLYRVSPEIDKSYKRSKVITGDILLTIVGSVGNLAKVPSMFSGSNLTQQTARLSFNQKIANADYYLNVLQSKLGKKEISNFTKSGVQPSLNLADVEKFFVPYPTLAEQQAIAEALSDTDALIESLEQLIAKKRQVKQGAMQELLTGKKRLPGFETKPSYKQTEVGVIPEDWEVKLLGELFEITSSKRVFQSEWKTEGIPFYRARELAVLGKKGYVKNELFISKEMYDTYKSIYGVPKIGDILVTGVGTLGKVYVVSDNHQFYFKDGNIIWFKTLGKIRSDFLRHLYLTPLILKQINNASAGTTVGTYTISGAKNTAVPYPSLAEQTAIATILSDIDTEIAALQAKLAKARHIKQGMMQELLTGRTRLL